MEGMALVLVRIGAIQMNWDALAAIATALSAVLVVVSLLLVWIQIRDLRKGVASSTYQTIVKMFDDYASQLIANPDKIERLRPGAGEASQALP